MRLAPGDHAPLTKGRALPDRVVRDPGDLAGYECLDASGIALHIHRDVLAALADPARLSFASGRFGRCSIRLGTGA